MREHEIVGVGLAYRPGIGRGRARLVPQHRQRNRPIGDLGRGLQVASERAGIVGDAIDMKTAHGGTTSYPNSIFLRMKDAIVIAGSSAHFRSIVVFDSLFKIRQLHKSSNASRISKGQRDYILK